MTKTPMGHTAYHHMGDLPGDCVPGLSRYQRSPSSPYFQFGAQRRYPFAWSGGPGGVPQSRVAAESRGLGIFDLVESGLEMRPGATFMPHPAFRRTTAHRDVPMGDWPLVRPAGREPDDSWGDGRGALGLSDNEKKLGLLLAVAGVGYLAYKFLAKRKNPVRRRYEVKATASRRARHLEYAGSFVNKRSADEYAAHLRLGGHKARVARVTKKKR
jgi:hypothetical protein